MTDVTVKVTKVDLGKRMVFGWGSVCKKRCDDGAFKIYTDTDNEQFPEETTLDAWIEYMKGDRIMDNMHDEKPMGKVIFAFPLMEDIAEALGLTSALDQTGVIVGTLVDDDEVLKKFHTGEYTGFSIGGYADYEDVTE